MVTNSTRLRLSAHLSAQLVHDVTKLVEVCLHLVMLQQRRGICCGLAEVGHHGSDRHLPRAVGQQAAGLQPEAGSMAVLPLPVGDRGQRSHLQLHPATPLGCP